MGVMYYAITGAGWGRGHTIDEAVDNYRDAIRRSWPTMWKGILDGEDAPWGFVWEAPEGADGFYLDSEIHWTGPDGFNQTATADQKRVDVGPVPAKWSVNPS